MVQAHSSSATLLQQLIQCASVTPEDKGAQLLLAKELSTLGFECHHLTFEQEGTPTVDNLYARLGTGAPHFVFAGHTDVVPVGDSSAWRHDPFSAQIDQDKIWGRGAVDMKASIAAFIVAVQQFLAEIGHFEGSISLLITGDEEGPAINGTIKMLEWCAAQNIKFDYCIVGEPTSQLELGDCIKVGRRGSLNGTLVVTGQQGHVAYPKRALNPVPVLAQLVTALGETPLDNGSAYFDPSNLEFTDLEVGNLTTNIIPHQAKARFNVRFCDIYQSQSLIDELEKRIKAHLPDPYRYTLDIMRPVGESFLTKDHLSSTLLEQAIVEVTGVTPERSTSGGTSDARFITAHVPVVEFGPVGTTMHQIDEHIALDELTGLTHIYHAFLKRYFGETR